MKVLKLKRIAVYPFVVRGLRDLFCLKDINDAGEKEIMNRAYTVTPSAPPCFAARAISLNSLKIKFELCLFLYFC